MRKRAKRRNVVAVLLTDAELKVLKSEARAAGLAIAAAARGLILTRLGIHPSQEDAYEPFVDPGGPTVTLLPADPSKIESMLRNQMQSAPSPNDR